MPSASQKERTRSARPPRVIHSVSVYPDRALDHKDHLSDQGRHPRMHERQVSAEGVTTVVYVLVADQEAS